MHLKFCRENNLNSKLVVKVHGNQVHLDPAPPSTSATPTLSKPEAVLSNDRSIPHKFTFDHSYWYENSVKKYFSFFSKSIWRNFSFFLGPTIDKMLISLVKAKFFKIWVWMWSGTPSMVIMFVFLPTDRLVVVKLTPWWAKRITRYYLVMICQIVTVVNRFYNNQRLHTTVVWKFPKSAMKFFEIVTDFGRTWWSWFHVKSKSQEKFFNFLTLLD